MLDLKRIPLAACLLLVLMRMSIGWQFLYEGLWKFDTLKTATPWSSEGYLKNARGPLRGFFRNMTGDPDDMKWLDSEAVEQRWTSWHGRFAAKYSLSDDQIRLLDAMINGPEEFTAPLAQLPEGVEIKGNLAKSVKYDAGRKLLVVDGKRHLLPAERDELLKLAPEDATDYRKAVESVFIRASRLSYKERMNASLKGDPTRAGLILKDLGEERTGEIELYKQLAKRYDDLLGKAHQDFEQKHLERTFAELQQRKAAVIGPIRALEKQMHAEAWKMLTPEQMTLGSVPAAITPVDTINQQTIWSLIILGALLIMGLFTRVAAFIGAGMLLMFYLPMPPWPGVPDSPANNEHSFIVNKNLIEAIALLAVACMPTGQWFGVDRWFQKLLYRVPKDATPAVVSNTPAPVATAKPAAVPTAPATTSAMGSKPAGKK